jgi:formylmethanofuran dehydrogenase subunit D
MEALSQLDISNPDHVSVINRDGKMIVSIVKDGASVIVSTPVRTVFDTTPRPPLQQPEPR